MRVFLGRRLTVAMPLRYRGRCATAVEQQSRGYDAGTDEFHKKTGKYTLKGLVYKPTHRGGQLFFCGGLDYRTASEAGVAFLNLPKICAIVVYSRLK